MKKKLLTYIIILICIKSFCQDLKVNSNINPFLLKPKWMNGYLETTSFRDGKELNIVRDLTLWGKTNNPSVFISKKNEYLYNYNALIENNALCPYGYKVPSYDDIFDSQIEIENNFFDPQKFSDKNKVKIYPYINHFIDDYLFLTPTTEIYLATTTENESIYEFNTAIVNVKSRAIEEWPLSKNSALGVKCVENFNESLKDEEFEYELVLPQEYDNLISKLSSILINSSSLDFKFSGKLRFDSNGSNVSDNFSVLDKTSNSYLYNSIKNAISGWKVYPYYNDIKVRSYQSIDISHQSLYRTQNEKRLFSNNIRFDDYYIDKSFLREVYKCEQGKRDFRFTTEIKTTKTTINNSITSQKEIQTINKFIGKGPIYSVYSLLPGLGRMQITKNSEKSRDVAYSRKLNFYLGTSISLGIIGGAAKLVSNHYYNEYKRHVFSGDPKNNFKIANVSQKIFLSCLYSYGAMFVWDFSSTFGIGIGNKVLQRKVNKKLRKLDTPLILK